MNAFRNFFRSVPWGAVAMVVAMFGWMQMRDANASADLARAKGCMACHAVDKKLVGPAFRDVSKKYRGDSTAVGRLAIKIKQGGAGVWGPIPMPPQPSLSDADAKKLAEWVMGTGD